MQTDMFPSQIKRPTRDDKIIVQQAAEHYAEEMHKNWPDYSKEEWTEALTDNYSEWKNGYEMAKDIERDGFEPDVEMVGFLDNFSSEVSKFHKKSVEKWVELVGFEPEFAIGDQVDMGESRRRPRYGVVASISNKTAEYGVKEYASCNISYIIKAEDLKKKID